MADVTVIGRGANVVGRITGAVDLAIHGRVEGDVSVDGDVTVESEGLVAANVTGKRVTIRGAVKGDVNAEDGIVLEDGARVAGDIRAPRVAVTRGALVRGYVETQGAGGAGTRGRSEDKASRPKPAAAPVPQAARTAPVTTTRSASGASLLAGGAPKTTPKGPPPPVVPVLRKGAKGTFKKKAG